MSNIKYSGPRRLNFGAAALSGVSLMALAAGAQAGELRGRVIDANAALVDPLPVASLGARVAAATSMGFVRALMDAWLEDEIGGSMESLAERIWPRVETIFRQSQTDVARL